MTHKQRGGTLLGLVVGSLVGLGVALAVAVYITKMPVPFTNKTLAHSPSSDAAETMKNKNWDPNAPLAGKNPARPAPSASGELANEDVSDSSAATVPDPVAPASRAGSKTPRALAAASAASAAARAKARASDAQGDAAKSAALAKPKPASSDPLGDLANSLAAPAPAKPAKARSSDPLGDLAKARSADPLGDLAKVRTTSAPVAVGSDPFTYFIQAGAFHAPEEAEKQRARLQALGVQAQVTPREQSGGTVYRVRVGPFEKKDEADKMKTKLDSQTVESALVKVQR